MWSSAPIAHLLQVSLCCGFKDDLLDTLVVACANLSYRCSPVSSNQPGINKSEEE